MLVDHHLHLERGPYTPEDYPRSWLDRYVAVMEERHVARLGIVEHGYRFLEARGILDLPWADQRCRYHLDRYLDFIFGAKAAGYPIAVGVEMDYVPGKEEEIQGFLARAPWDFVIGSVHFLGDWGIDLPEEEHRWSGRDPQAVWEEYYRLSVAAVRSGLFDILSHPDLPKIFGRRATAPLDASYAELVQALKEAGMAIEMNTAGLRKPVGEIYPVPDLLARALAAGVPVSTGSDAHVPEDVGAGFEAGVALLHQVGYRESVAYEARRATLYPLPD